MTMKALLLFAAGSLAAQQLVVDRAAPRGGTPAGQKLEAGVKGFLGDSFRIGAKGETWMIDSMRGGWCRTSRRGARNSRAIAIPKSCSWARSMTRLCRESRLAIATRWPRSRLPH